jgi:hypothetical protein
VRFASPRTLPSDHDVLDQRHARLRTPVRASAMATSYLQAERFTTLRTDLAPPSSAGYQDH